jgi:hypothetical protein
MSGVIDMRLPFLVRLFLADAARRRDETQKGDPRRAAHSRSEPIILHGFGVNTGIAATKPCPVPQ